MDSAGNLYGTCLNSGIPQNETIFQLSQSNGVREQKVIYNYPSPADNNGAGGLTMDANGNIFAVLSAAYQSPHVVGFPRTVMVVGVRRCSTLLEVTSFQKASPCWIGPEMSTARRRRVEPTTGEWFTR
jgi:hypothetical protein